jgi:hypothetical protein
MTRSTRLSAGLACVLALATLAAACQKKEAPAPAAEVTPSAPTGMAAPAVRVTDVQLGTAVGADKRVTDPKDRFSPKDTIFVSVVTEGSAPSATVSARWTFQDGQVVKEDSRSIAPTGTEATEFSIQKPDGWPAGDYKVEIRLNGQTAETKSFKVE